MSNTIQIKRRTSAPGNQAGAPTNLAVAELAFNEVDNTLYIGRTTGGTTPVTVEALAGAGAFLALSGTQTASGNYTFNTGTVTLNGTVSGTGINSYVTGKRLNEFTAPNAAVSFGSQQITNLAAPTADAHAATKKYVDDTVTASQPTGVAYLAANNTFTGINTFANTVTVQGSFAIVDGTDVFNIDQGGNFSGANGTLSGTLAAAGLTVSSGTGGSFTVVSNGETSITNASLTLTSNSNFAPVFKVGDGTNENFVVYPDGSFNAAGGANSFSVDNAGVCYPSAVYMGGGTVVINPGDPAGNVFIINNGADTFTVNQSGNFFATSGTVGGAMYVDTMYLGGSTIVLDPGATNVLEISDTSNTVGFGVTAAGTVSAKSVEVNGQFIAAGTATSVYTYPNANPFAVYGSQLAPVFEVANDGTVTADTLVAGTLNVLDKQIVLADVATPSDTTANGSGIVVKGPTNSTYKNILWADEDDSWRFNQAIHAAGTSFILSSGTTTVSGGGSSSSVLNVVDDYNVERKVTFALPVSFSTGSWLITVPLKTGTMALSTDKLSAFAATTSAELAGVISDETGTGKLVFSGSPEFQFSAGTTSTVFDVFNTTAETINAFGAATTVNIGANTGTTYIKHALDITGTISAANNNFTVDASGAVSAADGNFSVSTTGAITAAAGAFLVTSDGELSAASGNFSATTSGTTISGDFLVAPAGGGGDIFSVDAATATVRVNGDEVATKPYVDAIKQGLDIKDSVRVATTANITLSGTQSIDGVSVVAGDRVLVKNQSTASQNGIYVVAAGAWSRAEDADTSEKVTAGLFVFVELGTANADTGWVLVTDEPTTLGTTSLTFSQFSAAGQIYDGNGLVKVGNTISVGTASTNRIVVNADNIDLATTGVTAAANYTRVTVDAYGRVTAADSPLVVAAGKTLGVSNTLTFTGTDASSVAFGAGGTVAYIGSNNAFTGANTFTNTTGQTFRQAATQDGIIIRGRAGGTSTRAVTVETAALAANRTITLPDASGTVLLDSTVCAAVADCTIDGGTF
jgi:hypothetical protein